MILAFSSRYRICRFCDNTDKSSHFCTDRIDIAAFPHPTTYDSYVKSVSQRSAESRGFSPVTPVSSHREC